MSPQGRAGVRHRLDLTRSVAPTSTPTSTPTLQRCTLRSLAHSSGGNSWESDAGGTAALPLPRRRLNVAVALCGQPEKLVRCYRSTSSSPQTNHTSTCQNPCALPPRRSGALALSRHFRHGMRMHISITESHPSRPDRQGGTEVCLERHPRLPSLPPWSEL